MTLSQPSLDVEVPPVISWEEFYAEKAATLGTTWTVNDKGKIITSGEHYLFVGPTQSGKTLLCRQMARLSPYVVVLGTKPVDPSLDAYVKEGYVRIDHWPPTPADYRKGRRAGWDKDEVRFILWPKIEKRSQLRDLRPIYARLFDHVFIDGGWTVVADEGLWISAKTGLDLGPHMGDVAYGSASNGVSLYLCIQRPAGIPPVAWTSCSWAAVFHMGRLEDVRDIASLGVYPAQDCQLAVRQLRGHQFLDLPCRGGAEWSISEYEQVP